MVNIAMVSVTIAALVVFVGAGLPAAWERGASAWRPFLGSGDEGSSGGAALFHATALMFVAFTGYARIATLGEEVDEPRRTIPRAIVATLTVTTLLYLAVAAVGIGTIGPAALGEAAETAVAPLEAAARTFSLPSVAWLVTIGAMTAMLGVLVNLILGLSRMLLAMGRRRDMPALFGAVDSRGSPGPAVVAVGVVVAAVALVGDVRIAWSFSAFSVLIYYAITNLAALRLPPEKRLYPPALAWAGLGACLFLAFWVDVWIWGLGLALIGAGLAWHLVAARFRNGDGS